MLELSGWVSVGSFVSRSQPGAFLFVSSVFRRMGVAQKRFLVFVTRSGGFPTSSFVKGSRRRWSMALRAVLLAHSSLNAFCIEIHVGLPRRALCRSRRELSNAYFLAKSGFDTAENEPCQVSCPEIIFGCCQTTGREACSRTVMELRL